MVSLGRSCSDPLSVNKTVISCAIHKSGPLMENWKGKRLQFAPRHAGDTEQDARLRWIDIKLLISKFRSACKMLYVKEVYISHQPEHTTHVKRWCLQPWGWFSSAGTVNLVRVNGKLDELNTGQSLKKTWFSCQKFGNGLEAHHQQDSNLKQTSQPKKYFRS